MAAPDGGRHGALAVGRPGRRCKPRGQKRTTKKKEREVGNPDQKNTGLKVNKSRRVDSKSKSKYSSILEYRPIGRSRPKPQVRDTAELPCGKSVNRGASRADDDEEAQVRPM